MAAVGDDWILITHKSRHRARKLKKQNNSILKKCQFLPPDQMKCSAIRQSFAIAKAKLHGGTLVSAIVDKTISLINTQSTNTSDLNKVNCLSIICYGLGSFCTNSNAVKQLALSINVYEKLRSRLGEGCIQSLDIFDPAMTQTDEEIARDIGMNVLKVNERGFHKAERSTVFIMPHCGRLLYHNALVANLACRYLDNIVIVGNSFQTYNISIMRSKERRQSAIIAMLPYTSETSLDFDVPRTDPHYFQYQSAFSDLSVHTFSKVSMEKALEDPAVQCILENSLPDASDDEVLTQ